MKSFKFSQTELGPLFTTLNVHRTHGSIIWIYSFSICNGSCRFLLQNVTKRSSEEKSSLIFQIRRLWICLDLSDTRGESLWLRLKMDVRRFARRRWYAAESFNFGRYQSPYLTVLNDTFVLILFHGHFLKSTNILLENSQGFRKNNTAK